MRNKIRVGCGSAYAEDLLEPAVDLVDRGNLDYLCMDCLAERTLSIAQLRKLNDSSLGYDIRMDRMINELFPLCLNNNVKVIGNMGSANPRNALNKTYNSLKNLKEFRGKIISCILGDDVLEWVKDNNPMLNDVDCRLNDYPGKVVSANAYLGASPIVDALKKGADIIIGGRIADPSLFLAPQIYEFNWNVNDWDKLAVGQVNGHLLECGNHITGGNFADPPFRIVSGLDNLGFPFGDIKSDGEMRLSKLSKTGGLVSTLTAKAQLVWEIHDPKNYITPDVVVDLTNVKINQIRKNLVHVTGGKGKPASDTYRVLIGILEGWIGEGEITFAGLGAKERANLAKKTILKRLNKLNLQYDDLQIQLIGQNSVPGSHDLKHFEDPNEVRFRLAAKCTDHLTAEKIAHEVEYLVMGPAGACAFKKNTRQILGVHSSLIPKNIVKTKIVTKVIR